MKRLLFTILFLALTMYITPTQCGLSDVVVYGDVIHANKLPHYGILRHDVTVYGEPSPNPYNVLGTLPKGKRVRLLELSHSAPRDWVMIDDTAQWIPLKAVCFIKN